MLWQKVTSLKHVWQWSQSWLIDNYIVVSSTLKASWDWKIFSSQHGTAQLQVKINTTIFTFSLICLCFRQMLGPIPGRFPKKPLKIFLQARCPPVTQPTVTKQWRQPSKKTWETGISNGARRSKTASARKHLDHTHRPEGLSQHYTLNPSVQVLSIHNSVWIIYYPHNGNLSTLHFQPLELYLQKFVDIY